MDILRNFLAVLAAACLIQVATPAYCQGQASPIKLSTVVIDPGHGGKDAGCVSPSGKTMEKTVVLDIAILLADKIKARYPDVKVVMTRSDDTFVELQGRADIANKAKANLFISIHVNSVEKKRTGPNGYSVHILGQYTSKNKDLYAGNMDVVRRENSVIMLEDDYTTKYEGFDPSDPESYIFMNLMQNAFLEQSLKFARLVDEEMKGGAIKASRGISQDPFYVLWRTAMPAVLVECGFMSNPTDRGALITDEGKERIASDLFDAFARYKKEYDGGESPAPKVAEPKPAAPSAPAEEAVEAVNGTLYGIQVLVSSKRMAPGDPFFKGHPVKMFPAGNLYKYIICCSESLEETRKAFSTVAVSYPDSFIVKIEGDTFIRLK